MIEYVNAWLLYFGLSDTHADLVLRCIEGLVVVVVAVVAYLVAKRLLLRGVARLVKTSSTNWDDVLQEKRVFHRAANIAPAVVIYGASSIPLEGYPRLIAFAEGASLVYFIVIGAAVADALLSGLLTIYRSYDISHRLPIKSFLQVVKIVLFFVCGIFILSIIMGESPKFFLGGLGAITAVLMLIFKDSILGLVAGVQLSSNKMVRIGDWIEMPKYNADGDVIDISLTTVKVQNFDKTITAVPTYALISDAFKNWQAMTDAGGRRIKRSITIDISSIKFCDEAMLERFRQFEDLKEYMAAKEQEIADYNAQTGMDSSAGINGRRLTNVGTFRAYIVHYLRNHPRIHKDFTFLIRQLAPSEQGLPIQIYVFTDDPAWVQYEELQADIFDHLLAVVPEFDLRVFQNPTGADFQHLLAR